METVILLSLLYIGHHILNSAALGPVPRSIVDPVTTNAVWLYKYVASG